MAKLGESAFSEYIPEEAKRQERGGTAGFLESAWSSGTTELIGGQPTAEIARWRAENPGLALTSQILGQTPYFIAPFTRAGTAGVRMLPVFGRGVRTGERLRKAGRPALGELSRDISLMGAAETAKLSASALTHGPSSEELSRASEDTIFNMAATGVLSTAIGAMRRGIPPPDRVTNFETQVQREIDRDFALDSSPQIKMQRMEQVAKQAEDPGVRQQANQHIREYGREIRRQNVPEKGDVIRRVQATNPQDTRNTARRLSKLFKVKETRDTEVRKLIDSRQKGGFSGKGKTRRVIEESNLPEGFEKHAGFPRYFRAKTKERARTVNELLHKMSQPVMARGRQTWITREADDGPYVMVQRVSDDVGPVKPGDEFITFKTDDPAFFKPEVSGFARLMDESAFRVQTTENMAKPQGTLTKAYSNLTDRTPPVGVLGGEMSRRGDKTEFAKDIARRILGEERLAELAQATKGTTDFVGKFARSDILPSIGRYVGPNGSMRAAKISLLSKGVFDSARMQITHVLSGELKPGYRNSILREIFAQNPPREGGLLHMVDELPEEALPDITSAFRRNISPGDMAREGMNESAVDFMRRLDRIDRRILGDFNTMMDEIGEEGLEGMQNHFMLSRMWEGRLRLPLTTEKGNIVAIAAGRSKKEVIAEAERLKGVIDESQRYTGGVQFNRGQIRYSDLGDDIRQAKDILGDAGSRRNIKWLRNARDPKRFKERQGMAGFKFEAEDFTHKDLREILTKQVNEIYNLAAKRTTYNRLNDDILRLQEEDPSFHKMINDELKARFGERGEFSKAVEEFVDSKLTPLLGVNASEVVRKTNSALFTLTLGMGNIGFAVLNALTFMQTTLPEIAFLRSAPPARIRQLYGHDFVMGEKGIHEMWTPSPLKMVKQGWNDMSNPPEELWQIFKRARDEGRVTPVLAEEVFGPNSNLIQHFKGFLKEKRSFPEIIQEWSSYLPARTEELSRSMALSMGYRVGKDFMKLEGERLYQFATRFVDNTHFRYSASDRPLLLRGAFGSLLGLFKSWMLHYTGNTMRYAGTAIREKNFAPLLWSQAGTFSVAGLSGTSILPVAEGLNDVLSDDPLVQNVYEGLGYDTMGGGEYLGNPADGIFFGVPAFLGLSISHRAAVPGADIPNDLEQLYSIMLWDRAVAAKDLVGSSFDAALASGQHPGRSQEVRDALYRFALPRTLQAAAAATEERGTRSLNTQNKLLSSQTWPQAVIHALGFQPNEIGRTYEAMDVLFEQQTEQQEAIAAFSEMLTQARMAGDTEAIRRIYIRATAQGVPVSSIEAGARSREAKRHDGLLERQFDDALSIGMRRAIGSQ